MDRYGITLFIHETKIPADSSCYWDSSPNNMLVEIPKTASLSVSTAFGKKQFLFGHLFASQYPEKIRFKLRTIVRNPYDRLVSAYYFMIRGGFNNNKEYLAIRDTYKNFKDWVLNGLTKELITISFTEPLIKNREDWKEAFLPQYYWVTDHNGKLLISEEHIGKFENLGNDVKRLFNIDLHIHMNKSHSKGDWRTYYSDQKVIEKVACLYDKDFTLFGYSKDI
jgi:hypothetical protein